MEATVRIDESWPGADESQTVALEAVEVDGELVDVACQWVWDCDTVRLCRGRVTVYDADGEYVAVRAVTELPREVAEALVEQAEILLQEEADAGAYEPDAEESAAWRRGRGMA